jgi:hypothetical protein
VGGKQYPASLLELVEVRFLERPASIHSVRLQFFDTPPQCVLLHEAGDEVVELLSAHHLQRTSSTGYF